MRPWSFSPSRSGSRNPASKFPVRDRYQAQGGRKTERKGRFCLIAIPRVSASLRLKTTQGSEADAEALLARLRGHAHRGRMFLRPLLLLAILSVPGFAADGDAAKETRFLKNTRQLIYEGKRSGEGYFQPGWKSDHFPERARGGESILPDLLARSGKRATRRAFRRGWERRRARFSSRGTSRVLFASHARRSGDGGEAEGGARFPREREAAALLVGLRRDDGDLFVQRGRHGHRESHEGAGLRRGGGVLAGREADRLLLAALRISARKSSRPSSARASKKIRRTWATSTS